MAVTYLETQKFTDAVNAFKNAVKTYNEIKAGVERTTTQLFLNWQGEGRTQFEKDYQLIFQQLTDIGDVMYGLYDALIEAQATYVKTDEEISKQLTL